MSDHFEKHIGRLKEEKGEKWASDFSHEFMYFKVCHLMFAAREMAGMSRAAVSKQSGVPQAIIAKIERGRPGIDVKYLDSLNAMYTRVLAERKAENREAETNRLGALIASLSPEENQFSAAH